VNKLVIDTDVIAAALLGEPGRARQAEQIVTGAYHLLAPSHWQAELANVIWKAVIWGALLEEHVEQVLTVASKLPIASVALSDLWNGAVGRAIATKHPVYDTLFVELAIREKAPLVSFDQKLRKRFSHVVIEPKALVTGAGVL
jgi:predicted nucleic acid-binding protein